MQIGQRFKHATVGLRLFDYIFVLTRNYTNDTNTASKENYEIQMRWRFFLPYFGELSSLFFTHFGIFHFHIRKN